jgi:NMD protein affecting ribosome stability and mRNA decay
MEVRLRPRRKASTTSFTEQTAVLPNVCPECEGPGYLEYINLPRETKTQICRDCNLRWESAI